MNSILKHALAYNQVGLSVIPVNGDKTSLIKWQKYQKTLINQQKVAELFNNNVACLGIVAGKISKGLEAIDIDCKNDLTGSLYSDYCALVNHLAPGLMDKLVIEKTPSGGYHLFYRYLKPDGNMKLASRPPSDEELSKNPHLKSLVLIETRGEGGYVVSHPSPGYELLQGSIEQVPEITEDERSILMESAKSFNSYRKKDYLSKPIESSSSESPTDAYDQTNDVVDLLIAHGWKMVLKRGETYYFRRPGKEKGISATYNYIPNRFYCFSSSTGFEPEKPYKSYAVFAKLECNDDFKIVPSKLAALGYGKLLSKQDYIKARIITTANSNGKVSEPENILDVEALKFDLEYFNDNPDYQFWNEEWRGSDSNGKVVYSFNYDMAFKFLEANNFFQYIRPIKSNVPGSLINAILIKVTDNIVREVSHKDIQYFIRSVSKNLGHEILNMYYRGKSRYLGPEQCSNLMVKDLNFEKSGNNFQYLFFQKKVWIIRKGEKIEENDYSQLSNHVWQTDVIPFQPELLTNLLQIEFQNGHYHVEFNGIERSEFFRYLLNTCNFYQTGSKENPDTDFFNLDLEKQARVFHSFLSKMCAIGYLLHNYRDDSKARAVIAMDAKESDVTEANGRTGKSLTGNALEKLINTFYIDGKKHDLEKKDFVFDGVDNRTNLLFFDDVKINFNFDFLYNIINGRLIVNPKSEKQFILNKEDTPKIFVTTNHALNGKGVSYEARQWKIAYAPFYHPDFTPFDHFGHRLFDDWDDEQWNLFYNFMALCISFYLRFGIVEDQIETLNLRKLKQDMGETFLDWAEAYFYDRLNQEIDKDSAYADFMSGVSFKEKGIINKRQFKLKLRTFCDFKGYVFNPKELCNDKNGKGRIIKNSVEYFYIKAEKRDGEDLPF